MPLAAHFAATLRRVPLFADLSAAELTAISDRVTVRRYDARSVIFSEGDHCHELLIVQQGTVNILKSAPSGRQQLLSVERVGSTLSEVAVFDEGAYPASAQAVEATTVLRLDATRFREMCLQHPSLALKVMKVLGHRVRNLTRLVEDLSFSTVRGRLLAHLITLATERGRHTPRGVEFELLENNEALATRLGTVRELVSRNLGRLHNEQLIDIRRRTVLIPDPAALQEELREA